MIPTPTRRSSPVAWLVLVAAGLLLVVLGDGAQRQRRLPRIGPSVVAVLGALASLLLLAHALRTLPGGAAYAAWIGIGAAGVAAPDVVLVGEPLSLLRLVV